VLVADDGDAVVNELRRAPAAGRPRLHVRQRRQRREPLHARNAEQREPRAREGQRRERRRRPGNRRLPQRRTDRPDVHEHEHDQSDGRPPVSDSTRTHRDESEWLFCGDRRVASRRHSPLSAGSYPQRAVRYPTNGRDTCTFRRRRQGGPPTRRPRLRPAVHTAAAVQPRLPLRCVSSAWISPWSAPTAWTRAL
jgi:hypothetical protein